MKWPRVLLRLALLSLPAAAFVALTGMYGDSVHPPLPNPNWQAAHAHRESAPHVGKVTEFVGEILIFTVVAVAGRIGLRLRLSPVSRTAGQPVLLNLQRKRQP